MMVGPAGSPDLAKAVADAMSAPWPSPAIRIVNEPNAPNAPVAPSAPERWSPSIVECVVGVVGLLTLAATGAVVYLSLL